MRGQKNDRCFSKNKQKGVESMNKVDEFLTMTKLNDLLKKKDSDNCKNPDHFCRFLLVVIFLFQQVI